MLRICKTCNTEKPREQMSSKKLCKRCYHKEYHKTYVKKIVPPKRDFSKAEIQFKDLIKKD